MVATATTKVPGVAGRMPHPMIAILVCVFEERVAKESSEREGVLCQARRGESESSFCCCID